MIPISFRNGTKDCLTLTAIFIPRFANGLRGKTLYRINPASQLHGSIYTRETVKVMDGSSFQQEKKRDQEAIREAQSPDSQGEDGSFTASRDSFREGGKATDGGSSNIGEKQGCREGQFDLREGVI
jgi:hypothetical protein